MVLTNNKGETLKDGWVRHGALWKDTSKGIIDKPAGFYSIFNFKRKNQAIVHDTWYFNRLTYGGY